MEHITYLWYILAAQIIWTGVSYMVDSFYAKKFPDQSYFKKYWRTWLAFVLVIIDCGLVGFMRGIQPYIGA